jgi:cytochrome oxidase Cu insertion factor (SCO1/SenC/PrrC family)
VAASGRRLDLVAGFFVGRGTASSGPSSLADAVTQAANGSPAPAEPSEPDADLVECGDREVGMLAEGITAPEFELPDQDGQPVSLSSLRGHWVLLWWYPMADTPG